MREGSKFKVDEDVPGSAEDCERLIARVFGGALDASVGVIHVASVWRDSAGRYWTLAINDETPRSVLDQFVLGLARARADFIVTTGKILRAEPSLRHVFGRSRALQTALGAWRQQRFPGRPMPGSVVLSTGRDLPLAHPVFAPDPAEARPAPRVFTSRAAAAELASRAPGLEMVGRGHPSLRDCLASLSAHGGTTTIEAGASTSRELYDAPVPIDELLLSLFCESELAAGARGPEFVSQERLDAAFSEPVSRFESRQESGRWEFLRFRRG